jgi:hypothetical protein
MKFLADLFTFIKHVTIEALPLLSNLCQFLAAIPRKVIYVVDRALFNK